MSTLNIFEAVMSLPRFNDKGAVWNGTGTGLVATSEHEPGPWEQWELYVTMTERHPSGPCRRCGALIEEWIRAWRLPDYEEAPKICAACHEHAKHGSHQ